MLIGRNKLIALTQHEAPVAKFHIHELIYCTQVESLHTVMDTV